MRHLAHLPTCKKYTGATIDLSFRTKGTIIVFPTLLSTGGHMLELYHLELYLQARAWF